MPALKFSIVVVTVLVVGGTILYLILKPKAPAPPSVSDIVARVHRSCGHYAPTQPYTVTEAHEVMQVLIDCDADTCLDKGAARQVLIDSGRLRPSKQTVR